MTHKQAVEIIRDATESCILVMERGHPISSRSSLKSSRSSAGSIGQSSTNESIEPEVVAETLAKPDIHVVETGTSSENTERRSPVESENQDKPYPFVKDGIYISFTYDFIFIFYFFCLQLQ